MPSFLQSLYHDLLSAKASCGGNFSPVSGTEGWIVSPNYPADYPLNSDCDYVLTVDPGHVVLLEFEDFDLGEGHSCYTGDEVKVSLREHIWTRSRSDWP